MIGSLKTSAIYLFSSIGGGIFSCIISKNNGVGASVSIYGLLGAYVKYYLILDRIHDNKLESFR
jgi:membrane associated rhomboid family serine protease